MICTELLGLFPSPDKSPTTMLLQDAATGYTVCQALWCSSALISVSCAGLASIQSFSGALYKTPIYLYIPTYIHTYIHTYLPTYLHTYIHTYIYICYMTYYIWCSRNKTIKIALVPSKLRGHGSLSLRWKGWTSLSRRRLLREEMGHQAPWMCTSRNGG